MSELVYKDEAYAIVGAALTVVNELGLGFAEAVYQEALELELMASSIPHAREKVLPVYYKGKLLKKEYIADFVCYDKIIVELKAVETLAPEHDAQVLNYLKATGMQLGLLINFGSAKLQVKRLVR